VRRFQRFNLRLAAIGIRLVNEGFSLYFLEKWDKVKPEHGSSARLLVLRIWYVVAFFFKTLFRENRVLFSRYAVSAKRSFVAFFMK
jgi:hypothetical protein